MKKTIVALTLIFAGLVSFGQKQETKQEQKKDTTYFLLGNIADYQLLYKALTEPDNVTPNQTKGLVNWIQSIKALPEPKEQKKN